MSVSGLFIENELTLLHRCRFSGLQFTGRSSSDNIYQQDVSHRREVIASEPNSVFALVLLMLRSVF